MQKTRPTVRSDHTIVRPPRYESPYLQPLNNRIRQQKQKLSKTKARKKLRGVSNNLNQKILNYSDTGGSGDCKPEGFTQKFLDDTLHNIYKLVVENKDHLTGVKNWENKLIQELKEKVTDKAKMADQEEAKEGEASVAEAPPSEEPPADIGGAVGDAAGGEEAAGGGATEASAAPVPSAPPLEEGAAPVASASPLEEGAAPVASAPPEDGAAHEGGAAPEGGAAAEGGAAKPAVDDSQLADLPTADSKVMAELKEADQKAQMTAKIIENMKAELAALAKKEKMTPEDAKMIEQKQAELMEKLSEFERITTRVQELVGLTDITSKLIMEQKLAKRRFPPPDPIPEESLPKVIICGGGGIDPVPKIIVCEPTNRQGCGQPLYQQLSGRSRKPQNQSSCKKQMSNVVPSKPVGGNTFQQDPQQQQSWQCGATGSVPGGGGMTGQWGNNYPYNQVFPVGPGLGAWPPPPLTSTPSTHSSCPDTINPIVIKISTPHSCSPATSNIKVDQEAAGDAKNEEKSGEKNVITPDDRRKKECEALKQQATLLKKELDALNEENADLKNVLGVGKTVTLCRNEIAKEQVCKADIYKQIGLPLPKSYVQGECCRAYQDAMGLNFFNTGNIAKSDLINPPKSTLCKSAVSNAISGTGRVIPTEMMTSGGKVCREQFTAQVNPNASGGGGQCQRQSKNMWQSR